MRIASEQGQGAVNEDRAAAGTDWAFVLDGATAPPDVDTGCRHGVAWLVDRLAAALAAELAAERPASLPDCLAAAIERTRGAHGGGCDLGNPDSPSATAAVARPARDGSARLEYLVLADCTVLLPEPGGGVRAVTDDRVERLPGGRPYTRALVRAHRNAEGGFWVAGAVPEAAHRALVGLAPGRRFALLTDGCARLAEYFGHPWTHVWRRLADDGPEALVAWVRAEERRRGVVRGKAHDDATALLGEFAPPAGEGARPA
ncbi:protein phosphatase 2C domain-containing protein [Streptomonospora nanhaiensis]|nr:protein phosphatase 2C domain-containing protein [Streptomonospora nanhaiensis]MBV2364752.1 protein phosphatase 2C domain-containing protein [Streptomonospora nanhaiensis]MBV2366734.1 protein phosphatase 2C domain-containing protein [Streptomonospora nanhaiensis]MBX9389980.1 protein phosphatase 2C domain-containing protein [Streptomonospora nanhaiensis]